MVFDEYRQFYVGQSNDIRKRIKKHWSGRESFDRLVFGSKYESIFPMDELRALDTTRLYAACSTDAYAVEQRAEQAADPRFCLNRMMGGEASPLKLMLTALKPRTHFTEVTVVPLSREDYERAEETVANVIAQARTSHGSNNLVDELASLDMTIYSTEHENGSQVMWSKRDAISNAVACGELSVEEFAAFLTAMGEKIIWPES